MNEDLEKIARSNYLLLKIRQRLNLKGEIYTKWSQVGLPFNGGFFFVNDETSLNEVYFHDDLHFFRENLKQIQVGNILVSIGTQQNDIDWKDFLNQADTEFNDLIKEKGKSIFSQVNRFLLFLGCWEKEENPERLKTLINQICEDFPNSTSYQIEEILPSFEAFGKKFNFNAEVIFDIPLSKDEFIEILRKRLPDLRESIFGYGYSARNPVPDLECWIYLYVRQF